MTVLAKYKTFSKRFLAALVDCIVFTPFMFLDDKFHNDETSNSVFLGWNIIYMATWSLYSIIGHGRFGQTIGKWVMNIKVLDFDETSVIRCKRAFFRDSFYILAYVVTVAYFLMTRTNNFEQDVILRTTLFDSYMSSITIGWFLLEMVTMLFNNKRRAIHDFLAGSVVVDLRILRQENVLKQNAELLTALR